MMSRYAFFSFSLDPLSNLSFFMVEDDGLCADMDDTLGLGRQIQARQAVLRMQDCRRTTVQEVGLLLVLAYLSSLPLQTATLRCSKSSTSREFVRSAVCWG